MAATIAGAPCIRLGAAVRSACKRQTSTPFLSRTSVHYHIPRRSITIVAALGDGGNKKGLKREEEPEEYWSSASERKGESPFKDPLAIIGILAIFLPFLLLGGAIALGLVDLNGGR